MDFQNVSRPKPSGEMIPIPVMTILLVNYFVLFEGLFTTETQSHRENPIILLCVSVSLWFIFYIRPKTLVALFPPNANELFNA